VWKVFSGSAVVSHSLVHAFVLVSSVRETKLQSTAVSRTVFKTTKPFTSHTLFGLLTLGRQTFSARPASLRLLTAEKIVLI
jgi:hypothetical protein